MAAWCDLKGLQIPNLYPAGITGAFCVAYGVFYFFAAESGYFAGVVSHLASALIVFTISFLLFSLKMVGAGDSKLLSAFSLWAGMGGLLALLFYMALIGGVLGGFALWVQRTKPFKRIDNQGWIGRLQNEQNAVPYGIAISGGAIACFIIQGYISPETLQLLAMAAG